MEIRPDFESRVPLILPIFFGLLKDGGMITGGACGAMREETLTKQRAMAALFTNSLGLYKYLAKKAEPQTFYEKRLAYFGSGQGDDLIQERLYPQNEVSRHPHRTSTTGNRRRDSLLPRRYNCGAPLPFQKPTSFCRG